MADRLSGEWVNEPGSRAARQAGRQADKQKGRQADRQSGMQTGRHSDRQAFRQTGRLVSSRVVQVIRRGAGTAATMFSP